jgi:hypothetical protein
MFNPTIQITSGQIENCINRLESVLSENYGSHPIMCNDDCVGSLQIENKEVFISFRGSINRPTEIINLIFSKTTDLKEDLLSGKTHKNIYNKFISMKPLFWDSLMNALKDKNLEMQDIEMFNLEGYSQGSLFATFTAAYLVSLVGKQKLNVITLAPLGIFDEIGNKNYNELLGDRHISFEAIEDKLINFNSLMKPGQILRFSASLSDNFLQRVEQHDWTYLQPWAQIIIKPFINKETWEAHMPQTYAICSKIWEQHCKQNESFS